MMLAWEHPFVLDLPEHTADDCAQGLLDDFVIGNQAVRRRVAHIRVLNASAKAVKRRCAMP
jgi:hypothetical protein